MPDASPRYAGMIPEEPGVTSGKLASPRYAGMLNGLEETGVSFKRF